jgi:hypothetical protein
MEDANNVEKELLTSAVGFRFLTQIVDFSKINSHSLQYAAFIIADILLTGTVLVGGSKAIHSIARSMSLAPLYRKSGQRGNAWETSS